MHKFVIAHGVKSNAIQAEVLNRWYGCYNGIQLNREHLEIFCAPTTRIHAATYRLPPQFFTH